MRALLPLLFAAALALTACEDRTTLSFQGHGEADYVRVAAVTGGRIESVAVRRGDRIEAGDPLFALDDDSERAAGAAADSARAEAAARLADLEKGARPEEIEVLEAGLARARAALSLAATEYERRRELAARKVVSSSTLDQAEAARREAAAELREFEARIAEARLPARKDAIDAARAALTAADARLDEALWALDQRRRHAPVGGRIEDVFYEPGESVDAGRPVVVLLPPGAVFVRFYVPEPLLGEVRIGASLRLTCSGCVADLRGAVRFVSDEVEYSPPVIFSQERQDKLVYMAEAEIVGDGPGPRVGQPVTVYPDTQR